MGVIWTQMFPPSPALTAKNLPSQAGKVFIVTGGASGVGLELCRILYHAGGRVYLAGRSEAAARTAIDSITKSSSATETTAAAGEIIFLQLQLDDLSAIATTVDAFRARESKLDVLWNNAGTGPVFGGAKSAQGHDLHLATNCLGPFLLTKLLQPCLEAAAAADGQSRVVWTTSMLVDAAAPAGGFDVAHLDAPPNDPNALYTITKVGNWFLAAEMARRTPSRSGVLSIAQNPGNLKTRVWRNQPRLMVLLLGPVLYEAHFGAYTELWAGLSADVDESHNGELVVPWGRWHPRPREDILKALKSRDDGGAGKAEAFWDWCEAHTNQFC